MYTVDLSDAKQNLSEIVDRASKGEKIAITRNGKLEAYVISVHAEIDVNAVFGRIEELRKRVKPHKRPTARQMITEGRR